MVNDNFLSEINAAYHQLDLKQAQVTFALSRKIFELESGWYNGHYHKTSNDDWEKESYPIPVVSVKGLCDIEISFDKISISTKLRRTKALEYSYAKIMSYNFEVFGVNDYLSDYYKKGQSIEALKRNISDSDEQEIGFAFTFSNDVDSKTIFEFAKLLRREGFYY